MNTVDVGNAVVFVVVASGIVLVLRQNYRGMKQSDPASNIWQRVASLSAGASMLWTFLGVFVLLPILGSMLGLTTEKLVVIFWYGLWGLISVSVVCHVLAWMIPRRHAD